MEDNCTHNELHNNFNTKHVGAPVCMKDMEISPSEDEICARWCDLCSSTRSISWLRFERSKMVSSEDAISMSPRRGASIISTMSSRYFVVPRKLRRLRTRRITRFLGSLSEESEDEEKVSAVESKWSERVRSCAIPDKTRTNWSTGIGQGPGTS